MKKKKGRPRGLLRDAGSMEWSDIEGTLAHGSKDWRMIKLRQEIGDGSVLPDNFLSAELAKYNAMATAHVRERKAIFRKYRTAKARLRQIRLMRHKLPLMPPILVAWKTLLAQFERAVLDGDAIWFADQAKAIDPRLKFKVDQAKTIADDRQQFNKKIVGLLHQAAWPARTPAGTPIPWTVGQIWDQLDDVEKCPTDKQPDRIKVEGVTFKDYDDCSNKIRVLAKEYLRMVLRDEQGKHDSAKRRGGGRRGGFTAKERNQAIARLQELVRG